ncbi:hypothetical protein ACGF13_06595 [Kitasatospora sp. NPDC048286]|uniref:class III lanthionine synthetase LanKC N-terminal domain-containing protein n=1 Tax=Kitasatospora sp. NPDC048286 TaxID=3364047 RepID=UPI00371FB5D3
MDRGPGAAGSWPETTRAALAGAGGRGGGGDWDVTVGGSWCTARPSASAPLPERGWKLRVSAASAAGEAVLSAVVRVLAGDPCRFRFAAAQEHLSELNSRNGDRGAAGEFITVYPADDAQFQRLAAELDRATAGLPGPVVPSDRPYRAGSRVHYRYGAFAPPAEPGEDGREVASGAEVVVKQARAHLEVGRAGTDAREALRHEAALLDRPAGRGLAPRPLELIEEEDSLFLVQERITGQPLGCWVAARLRRDGGPGVDWAEAGPVAHGLLDLVERVHAQGLVLHDLSPGNVMVRPDGTPRLVDLERATEAGRLAGAGCTPGYRAPEHGPGRLALAARGRVADPAVDLYALGGLLFLLATGHDPLLPEDLPRARPAAERLGRWLALAARTGGTARRLAPAVLGLRAEDPERRWAVARVRAALNEDDPAGPAAFPRRPRHGGPRLRPAPAPPAVRRQPPDRTDPSGTTGVSGA